MANQLELASFKVSVGDLVYYQESAAGIVKACVADGSGSLHVVVDVLQFMGKDTAHSDRWSLPRTQLEQWPAEELVQVRAWYIEDDCFVVIL